MMFFLAKGANCGRTNNSKRWTQTEHNSNSLLTLNTVLPCSPTSLASSYNKKNNGRRSSGTTHDKRGRHPPMAFRLHSLAIDWFNIQFIVSSTEHRWLCYPNIKLLRDPLGRLE